MMWDAVAQSPSVDNNENDNFRSTRDKQLSTSLLVEMMSYGFCFVVHVWALMQFLTKFFILALFVVSVNVLCITM